VLCVVKGAIAITATGGTAPYQYLWNNGATTAQINNLNAGFYNLKITDANNCSIISSSIRVDSMSNVLQPNLGRDTAFCSGNLLLSPGMFDTYRWQDNTTSTNYLVSQTGKYWVRVFDANGCTAIDTIAVTIDCSGIFFPSAFTPNRDFKNDGFGPLGNLAAVNNYQLRVYNRWGQVVFFSTNPYAQWDGKMNGRDADIGTFIWTASFAINNQPIENRKGTVTLIR
jgi:gliding motility-associated-like protein